MRRALLLLMPLPLLVLCLLIAVAALVGLGRAPVAEQAALARDLFRSSETALLCLVLAAPVAARSLTVAWLLPLATLPPASAAGLAAMRLGGFPAADVVAGAVLLLPAMVLILRRAWRRLPGGAREEAVAQGAGFVQSAWIGAAVPALPGAAWGAAIVFLLATGLGPLLAGLSVSP